MTVAVHTFSPLPSEVTVTRTVAQLPNSSVFFFRIFMGSKNLMTIAERIEDDIRGSVRSGSGLSPE